MKNCSRTALLRSMLSVVLASGLAAGALAQAPGPVGPGAAANAEEMQRRQEEQNRRPDNIGTGEYPAMKEALASLPAHTIYRPQNLEAMGNTRLGVVAWGNGGCSPDAASSRFHLLELASHGYLVIANGTILSGPGAPPREPRQAGAGGPGTGGPSTTAAQLTEAIDWALNENARQGSPYFGRIDPDMIAVAGFSCGGIQAIAVADDPRLKTIVMQNTGLIVDGTTSMGGMTLDKNQLEKVHTPIFYILGGPSDIAYVNGMDDFEKINHQPVAVANLGDVGHGGTYAQENGGRAAQAAVKWLDWVLRGDAEAGTWFLGENCVLCTDAEWEFDSKNLENVMVQ